MREAAATRWINLSVTLLLGLVPNEARAQACCAGGATLAPTRLELHETALVGVQLGTKTQIGAYNGSDTFRGNPAQTSDLELRQEVFAAVQWLGRVQTSALLPWIESFRSTATSTTEAGGGLGDGVVSTRVEVTQLNEYSALPAISVALGVVLPTGTPAEDAQLPLGTDATGSGFTRFSLGLGIEQTFSAWLVSAQVSATHGPHRRIGALTAALGPGLNVGLALGHAWSHAWSSAVLAAWQFDAESSVDGQQVAGSGKHQAELGLSTTFRWHDVWRVQLRANVNPPLSDLGSNDSAWLGANVALARSWL